MAQDDTECVVCFSPTDNTLPPCDHRVCLECIQQWTEISLHCPMCRGVLLGRHPLQPPDECPVTSTPKFPRRRWRLGSSVPRQRACIVHSPPGTFPGISFYNAVGGVLIRWLRKVDQAYKSGLRVGDVVTHINGMPVTDHATAVKLFDTARVHGVTLTCTLRGWQCGWSCLGWGVVVMVP